MSFFWRKYKIYSIILSICRISSDVESSWVYFYNELNCRTLSKVVHSQIRRRIFQEKNWFEFKSKSNPNSIDYKSKANNKKWWKVSEATPIVRAQYRYRWKVKVKSSSRWICPVESWKLIDSNLRQNTRFRRGSWNPDPSNFCQIIYAPKNPSIIFLPKNPSICQIVYTPIFAAFATLKRLQNSPVQSIWIYVLISKYLCV